MNLSSSKSFASIVKLDSLWRPIKIFSRLLNYQIGKRSSRVLILKFSEQGAVALASPLLKRATNLYGRENVFYITLDVNLDIYHELDFVERENILIVKTDNVINLVKSILNCILKLRSLKLKAVLNLDFFYNFSQAISQLCGAGKVFYLRDEDYQAQTHVYTHYKKLFLHFDSRFDDKLEYLTQNYDDIKTVENSIYLYINHNDVLKQREWPIDKWKGLTVKLKEMGYCVNIIGPSSEEEFLKLFSLENGVNFISTSISLSELIKEIKKSDVLITTDSGPSHFADLIGANVITLFGPETPDFFGSLNKKNYSIYKGIHCSPCFNQINKCLVNCRDNQCMKEISIDDIIEKLIQIKES